MELVDVETKKFQVPEVVPRQLKAAVECLIHILRPLQIAFGHRSLAFNLQNPYRLFPYLIQMLIAVLWLAAALMPVQKLSRRRGTDESLLA
jgi:hypothetical protein